MTEVETLVTQVHQIMVLRGRMVLMVVTLQDIIQMLSGRSRI